MFCNGYTHVSLVFQKYVASISTVLDTVANVSSTCCKVDLVLHMLQWTLSAAAGCCSCWAHLHACGYGGGMSDSVGNHADAYRDGAGVGHRAMRD
jgi:hypothetical protein